MPSPLLQVVSGLLRYFLDCSLHLTCYSPWLLWACHLKTFNRTGGLDTTSGLSSNIAWDRAIGIPRRYTWSIYPVVECISQVWSRSRIDAPHLWTLSGANVHLRKYTTYSGRIGSVSSRDGEMYSFFTRARPKAYHDRLHSQRWNW